MSSKKIPRSVVEPAAYLARIIRREIADMPDDCLRALGRLDKLVGDGNCDWLVKRLAPAVAEVARDTLGTRKGTRNLIEEKP
jgi:hypothetical protein